MFEQGKYEDAINIESGWHEAIQKSDIPITPICLYKSIPDNVEDRFSEIHDLVIKHAVTSTGVLRQLFYLRWSSDRVRWPIDI